MTDNPFCYFEGELIAKTYNDGIRAATDICALIMYHLSVSDIEIEQDLDLVIRLYCNSKSLLSQDPSARGPFTNFYRGFNSENPLSMYEDTSESAPSSAGGKKPTPLIHEVPLPSS